MHLSRRGTSEVDEQSVPLAGSLGADSTKPVGLRDNRKWKQAQRASLVGTAFARAIPEDVQLKAIAQVTEDPRRASIAIRRRSLIQSLQDGTAEGPNVEFYRSPARGSLSALMPGPPVESSSDRRISAFPEKRLSIAQQGSPHHFLIVCCEH